MHNLFYRWGQWIYRFKYPVIVVWLLGFLASTPVLPKLMEPFQSSGFQNIYSDSVKTDEMVNHFVGYQKHRVLVLYQKKTDLVSDELMNQEIQKSLKNLKKLNEPYKLLYQTKKNAQLVVIAFKGDVDLDDAAIKNIESLIKKPKHLEVYFGGEDVFVETVNAQTEKDLFRADMVAAPFSAITLLFVFGSLVAAFLPLLLGGCCALLMFSILYFLAHHMDLSIFTINIALLLGLCLSLDYALFIISRFREELHQKKGDIEDVIALTMSTAGKAVFFSGLAVFASLSALLLFPINILISIGTGGLCAVFLAVLAALTLLPALLSIIKGHIYWSSFFKTGLRQNRFWHHLAGGVIKRPWFFVIFGTALLLAMSYPLKNLKLGISDFHILPENSAGRAFFKVYGEVFGEKTLSPISVVIKTKTPILSENNIKRVYHLIDDIQDMKSVKQVEGYLSWLPNPSLAQYQKIYAMDSKNLPPEVLNLLNTSVSKRIAVIQVISRYSAESQQTQDLVKKLRQLEYSGLQLSVTGSPAQYADVFDGIRSKAPKAIYLIISITFLVLMILLRSLFLPFKAIVMNILSLCATYGVLVYVFQEGHFHELLNFEPQGSLDISMMVIIFCALFGFSMDYEVFLLSRIHECYEKHRNNKLSIVYGIEHSARIITSAAMIVIVLCGSFLVADVLMVKAFGLGIAIAIFVDAFIIRTFIVPALMTITSSINWYFPRWCVKLLPKQKNKG